MEEVTKAGSMAEAVLSSDGFKRKFTLGELFRASVWLPSAISTLKGNRKSGLLDGLVLLPIAFIRGLFKREIQSATHLTEWLIVTLETLPSVS